MRYDKRFLRRARQIFAEIAALFQKNLTWHGVKRFVIARIVLFSDKP
jgi:hypothetical protein